MDGRFHDVNEAWLRTLGYSREEVIGRTSTELGLFVAPRQAEAAGRALDATGRIRDVELEVRHKDGTTIVGRFSGEKVVSRGQRFFLTVMIDATAQRGATEARRESEARYRTLAETAPVGVVLAGLDGRILMANPAILALHGVARAEDLVGRRLPELLDSDDPARTEALLAATVTSSREAPFETRLRRVDGTTVEAELTVTVIRDGAGRPQSLLGIARDVSGRRRAMRALEHSNEFLRTLVARPRRASRSARRAPSCAHRLASSVAGS